MSSTVRPLASLAALPQGPSKRTPSGQPTALRHWIAYHSPDVMGYEFFECADFAILTNKRIRDIMGDVVWVIGRKRGTHRYYLDVRFRITQHKRASRESGFKFRIGGTDGTVFFPTPDVTKRPWFRKLFSMTSNFSVGFQHISDEIILDGLKQAYEETLEIQRAGDD